MPKIASEPKFRFSSAELTVQLKPRFLKEYTVEIEECVLNSVTKNLNLGSDAIFGLKNVRTHDPFEAPEQRFYH